MSCCVTIMHNVIKIDVLYSDFFDNAFDDHWETTSYNEKKWKLMLAPYVINLGMHLIILCTCH